MGKDIHIQRNNAVYIRLFIMSVLGLVVTISYYLGELASSSLLWMIFLSFIAVVFLFSSSTALMKLLKKTPALSITKDGIVDNISLAKMGYVSWKEIKSVKFEKYLNQDQLLIAVYQSEQFIDSLSFLKRNMVNQQFVDTGAIIVVNPKMIRGNIREFAEKIKRRARV